MNDGTARSRRSRVRNVLLSAAAGVAVVGVVVLAVGVFNAPDRQQLIAERGAEVMPFDLDLTTHLFEPTFEGGVETIVFDDPSDTAQIELIRQHLREEAQAFARGDYGDPSEIHGADMPGLSTLEANADQISVEYRTRSDGAEVHYTTDAPALVEALHDWFAAQTSDHEM